MIIQKNKAVIAVSFAKTAAITFPRLTAITNNADNLEHMSFKPTGAPDVDRWRLSTVDRRYE